METNNKVKKKKKKGGPIFDYLKIENKTIVVPFAVC